MRQTMEFQTVGGVASQVGEIVTYDLPDDEWNRYVRDLATITPAQATQAARDHLNPDAVVIVVVGDRERIEPGIKELGIGDIQLIAATGEE